MQTQPAYTETRSKKPHPSADRGANKDKIHLSITVGKSPEELFDFWRNLENLPRFIKQLSSVQKTSPQAFRCEVILKSGEKISWEAKIVEAVPNKMICWQNFKDSKVQTSGTVWFEKAPKNLGTIVTLQLSYEIPGGKLAELMALFSEETPELLAATNLKRLKAVLETGVIATTDGQPSGREEENYKN